MKKKQDPRHGTVRIGVHTYICMLMEAGIRPDYMFQPNGKANIYSKGSVRIWSAEDGICCMFAEEVPSHNCPVTTYELCDSWEQVVSRLKGLNDSYEKAIRLISVECLQRS